MKLKTLIATILLSLLVSCGAKDVKPDYTKKSKDELVDEVYIKSGLSKQIPSLRKHSDALAKQYEGRIPPAVLNRLHGELNKIYDPVRLENNIKKRISSKVSKEVLIHMIKWYNKDIGKKITALEVKSSQQEESSKKIAFIRANQNTVFPGKRFSLIKRLLVATDSIEMATGIGIYLDMSILDMLNDMNPNTKPYTTAQLKHHISQRKSMIRGYTKRMLTLGFIYLYKDLSDKELLAYVEAMETRNSKVFIDEVNSALFNLIYTKADLSL